MRFCHLSEKKERKAALYLKALADAEWLQHAASEHRREIRLVWWGECRVQFQAAISLFTEERPSLQDAPASLRGAAAEKSLYKHWRMLNWAPGQLKSG